MGKLCDIWHTGDGIGNKAINVSGSRKQSNRSGMRMGFEWHLGREWGLIWDAPAKTTGSPTGVGIS